MDKKMSVFFFGSILNFPLKNERPVVQSQEETQIPLCQKGYPEFNQINKYMKNQTCRAARCADPFVVNQGEAKNSFSSFTHSGFHAYLF